MKTTLALALLLLPGPGNTSPKTRPVASLDNSVVITEADLSDWQASQACYGQGAMTSREAAFMRLLEAAIAERAMRSAGKPRVASSDLAKEAGRIDRETRAPDILDCIKRHFGKRVKRYHQVFVKTAFVESRMREFIMRDPKVQEPLRRKVASAAEDAARGSGMAETAERYGLSYASSTYQPGDGPARAPDLRHDRGMPPHGRERSVDPEFVRPHLAGLSPGELKKGLIESDYAFQIVRLLERREDGSILFETISSQKISQEEWLKTLPKMRLVVPEEGLRRWVSGIKGNPRLAAATLD
ncbi:MAG: hypothetical protein WC943_16205 [Elusimicrobiota bacterium]|jgi:hypothetical protein